MRRVALRAAGFVRFLVAAIALPGFAVPLVVLDLRVLALAGFAAFALACADAALVAFVFLVTREARRFTTRGDASSTVSVAADLSVSRAASPAGASVGRRWVFTGCQVCAEPMTLCLRNSRAASSWLRRPRCEYVPGFTLFCLLRYGTSGMRPGRVMSSS